MQGGHGGPEVQNNLNFLKAVLEFLNRVGIVLSYRPAMLYRLAESILWNPFLGSLKVQKMRALNKMKKDLYLFLLVSEITDDGN
jgi:hypothetical protein